jgi:hypothetical protein
MPDEHDRRRNAKRIQSRAASLTADELDVGSDDRHAQAKAILDESDDRAEDRISPPGKPIESGRSDDNVAAVD